MTLQTLHISKSYAASEGEDTFAYDFLVFQNSHFNVYVGTVLQDYGTDFIATGVGDPSGGNIILTTPIAPGGATVLIKRIVPLTQMSDYVENDALPAEVLERGFDKLTMIAQQLQSAIVSGGGGAGDEALQQALDAHISDVDDSVHDVGTHIETHNALATGVHGVGASTVESTLGSQTRVDTHAALTSVHGATDAATPDRIVLRDASGTTNFSDATSASHPATWGQTNTKITTDITNHNALFDRHGATDANTANTPIRRDASGNAKVSDGVVASDIATKGQVDTVGGSVTTHAALTTGVHGVGGSTVASVANIATHAALTTGVHGAGASTLETIVGSQTKVDLHDSYTNAHSATAAAIAGRIVFRDITTGRAAIADGSAASDIATKGQLDTHAALTNPHSATAAATANRLMLRDASGRSAVATGSAAGDIANTGQITTHSNLTSGVHGVGASMVESTVGSQNKVNTHAGELDAHGATATPTANRIPLASASGNLDAWVSTIGFNNMMHVRDVKSTGTAGGTFTSGAWRTRDLNTVISNTIPGASLSANHITLPAGTYYVSLRAPANKVDAHQIRWQNVTDSTNILFGSNAYCGSGGTYAQTDSMLFGVFTLAATKNIELQHRCATTNASNGFGRPTSWGDEVYSEVVIFKI